MWYNHGANHITSFMVTTTTFCWGIFSFLLRIPWYEKIIDQCQNWTFFLLFVHKVSLTAYLWKLPKKGRNILKASGSKIKSGSFKLAKVAVPSYHSKLPLFTCRPYRCEISSLTLSVPCLGNILFRFFSYTGWSVCVGPVQLVFFDMSLCRTILQVIGKHRCYGKLLSYWTCSFPMSPPVRRRSVAVGLSQFS